MRTMYGPVVLLADAARQSSNHERCARCRVALDGSAASLGLAAAAKNGGCNIAAAERTGLI